MGQGAGAIGMWYVCSLLAHVAAGPHGCWPTWLLAHRLLAHMAAGLAACLRGAALGCLVGCLGDQLPGEGLSVRAYQ